MPPGVAPAEPDRVGAPVPDVSVVIPTFRRERLLLETIASALAQGGVALEVLVVDDSPEGSARPAVEAVADPRLRYLHRAQPSGGRPALVRNEGAARCAARNVQFLDDDDLLMAGALSALSRALDGSRAGVAFGAVEPFGASPDEVERERAYFARAAAAAQSARGRLGMVRRLLFEPALLVCSACMVRRTCLDPLGGFDATLEVCEDTDFFTRAIRAFGCVYLPRTVLRYRVGGAKLSTTSASDGRFDRSYRILHGKYREQHGALEFYALKAGARVARAVGRH